MASACALDSHPLLAEGLCTALVYAGITWGAVLNVPIIHANDFLETSVDGTLNAENSRRMLLQIATSNENLGHDLLRGVRRADGTGVSFSEVFDLVKVMEEHPEASPGKAALLDTYREGFEKVQFFEASAAVEGLQVRAFLDFEQAIHWLHGTVTTIDADKPSNGSVTEPTSPAPDP